MLSEPSDATPAAAIDEVCKNSRRDAPLALPVPALSVRMIWVSAIDLFGTLTNASN